MPRRRLGVVVLIDPPVATEIDGLRRALGDGALARIAPHITLVPPVNVPVDRLPDALARLRASAAACDGPCRLTLGPVGSFLPANPVLLLAVDGDLAALRRLRDAAFAGPFERPLSWPWVPHVTLADELDPQRVGAAVDVLDGYRAAIDVERVTVLEEVRSAGGRRWQPLADATIGPRRIVGRGGLPLELTIGLLVDPEAEAVLRAAGVERRAAPDLVVTARRGDVAVGVAAAWVEPDGTPVGAVVHPDHRGQGIGTHLLAALGSERYSKATDE